MQFHKAEADIFVPDGTDLTPALGRTTHLCLAAHQDDIEIMAYHGIAECFGARDRWFTGVVATDGAGSPRTGIYSGFSDAEMRHVRIREQREAARIGAYACQIQLGYCSAEAKNAAETALIDDLKRIFLAARPETVYLHNPADKHDTHVAVALRGLAAMRALRAEWQPRKVYGCEVWRDLDWLQDEDKRPLPVSQRADLAAALLAVFDSQVSGGKRYDLATAGRRLAHATYFESHGVDGEAALDIAMDLTPLAENPELSITEYVLGLIDRFRADVVRRLSAVGASPAK